MIQHTGEGVVATPISTLPLSKFSRTLSSCLAALSAFWPALASAGQPAPASAPLLVAAAADLTPLEKPIREAFERATGLSVRFVLGSSGMLTRQIEQGAPYDVFLSANEKLVADLANEGRLAPGSLRAYAYGRLGLWSRDGSVKSLAELRGPRILHVAIANPVHAPYGQAAKEALQNQGLWKELQVRIVYGENVRQALQYAESGNADAVITAWSLVLDRGGILLPDNLHSPIRQACGIMSASRRAVDARRFLDFLAGPEGRKILEQHGLFPPK